MIYEVLFVCNASRRRSAGLCAYFNCFAEEKKASHLKADSAGADIEIIEHLRRRGDSGPNPILSRILCEQGICQIEKHRIKHISELGYEPDLVLACDEYVLSELLECGPFQSPQLAKEYAGMFSNNIYDFLKDGFSKEKQEKEFRKMARELREVAERVFERVLREQNRAVKHY